MAYEVTATRKRPQTFGELEGQDFVVASITNSLTSGKLAHAYLFSGPRGVGKTSAARILAKSLNCEQGPTATPCGVCSNCTEIARGNSLDVIEIDGASNTSVNDVREIRDEVLFSPSSSRYKVYIIDEVHMLSNSAFNALLKTIEEPPPYIVFVFATTEVHKVPATIRSRCQQFNFRLIAVETIVERLEEVVEESGLTADPDALFWIGKEAAGSMRDAYTLYDQIASFADGQISMELIRDKLGLVGFDRVDALAAHLVAGEAKAALELIDDVLSRGVAIEQLANDLTDYFRGLLFARHGIDRESLIGYHPASFSQTVAEGLTVPQIEYVLGELLGFYRAIRYSLDQRLELELLMSRLSLASTHLDQAEIVERLKSLKAELSGGATARTSDDSATTNPPRAADETYEEKPFDDTPPDSVYDTGAAKRATPAGAAAAAGGASGGSLSEAERRAIIDAIKRSHLSLAATLEKCEEWHVEKEQMTIACPSPFHVESIRKELPVLSEAVKQVLGASLRVQVRTKRDTPADEGDEESDTRVSIIKRVFRGEVIDYGRPT